MYQLTLDLLPRVFLLVVTMMLLPAALLYLHTRRRTSPMSVALALAVVMGMISLLLVFCYVAAFNPVQKRALVTVSLLTFITFIVISAILGSMYLVSIVNGRKKAFISPDLYAVYRYADDLILQLDHNGQIIDINHEEAFLMLLGKRFDSIAELVSLSEPVPNRTEGIAALFLRTTEKWQCDVTLNEQSFIVMNTPVMTKNEPAFGSIMVFHNITEEKENELALSRQNDELSAANRKLENLVKMVGILEAEQTKAEMLRLVQIELTDRIDEILTDIRKLCVSADTDVGEYKMALGEIIISLRDVYRKVRKTIQSFTIERDRI